MIGGSVMNCQRLLTPKFYALCYMLYEWYMNATLCNNCIIISDIILFHPISVLLLVYMSA